VFAGRADLSAATRDGRTPEPVHIGARRICHAFWKGALYETRALEGVLIRWWSRPRICVVRVLSTSTPLRMGTVVSVHLLHHVLAHVAGSIRPGLPVNVVVYRRIEERRSKKSPCRGPMMGSSFGSHRPGNVEVPVGHCGATASSTAPCMPVRRRLRQKRSSRISQIGT
jgi:hypothetical protein